MGAVFRCVITNLVSLFNLSAFSSNTSFLMKLWPAILSQLSYQSINQRLFTPSELLCGGFWSRCSPLPRLISLSRVLGSEGRYQGVFYQRFSPRQGILHDFVHSCSAFASFEVNQLAVRVSAETLLGYLSISISLGPRFFTQTGVTQQNFCFTAVGPDKG